MASTGEAGEIIYGSSDAVELYKVRYFWLVVWRAAERAGRGRVGRRRQNACLRPAAAGGVHSCAFMHAPLHTHRKTHARPAFMRMHKHYKQTQTLQTNKNTNKVVGDARELLHKGAPLEVRTVAPTRAYPVMSAVAAVWDTAWPLRLGTHAMKSFSTAGEPTYIFANAAEQGDAAFYCVIFKRGHAATELARLEALLTRLTTFHQSDRPKPAAAKVPALPALPALPAIDHAAINEVLRKGAEDTQMLAQQAGAAAAAFFSAAADLHKKYAPKPADKPVEVSSDVKAK
jgi:hypothetical protein